MKKINRTLLQITEKYYWLWFALLCAVTVFLCFRCLGVKAIDSWDEARHGISAYEMLKNKQFLVNTYLGKPDYWNVKPPLSFLSVAAGFVLCGYNAVGRFVLSSDCHLCRIICQKIQPSGIPADHGLFMRQLFSIQSASGTGRRRRQSVLAFVHPFHALYAESP